MAQVCYSVAMSVDGFIAGPNGETDWVVMDPEIDFAELWARFETLLMGRRTYEAAVKRFGDPGFQGKRVLVASRTQPRIQNARVTLLSEVNGATMQRVRSESERDIWLMGGGELSGALLQRGEVDQVELIVVPVLLGSGTPVVGHLATREGLILRDRRVYPTGQVSLRYDVSRRTA